MLKTLLLLKETRLLGSCWKREKVWRLVYGADDPKAGACRTLYEIIGDPRLNHCVPVVIGGVLAERCSELLREFFAERRE